MKSKFLALFLALCSIGYSQINTQYHQEKVIVSDGSLSEVNTLLELGWTVKHVQASIAVNTEKYNGEIVKLFVFVVETDDHPNIIQARIKERNERIRQEYLARKYPKVEK